jgi:hypothetical protein
MRKRTLLERKAALEMVLARCPRIKFASHIEHEGEAFYDQLSQLALEGIVCKCANSPYVAGRSHDWIKGKTAAGMQVADERLRHLRASSNFLRPVSLQFLWRRLRQIGVDGLHQLTALIVSP